MRMSMEQLQEQQLYTDQQISELSGYIDSLEENLALLRFDAQGKIFHASQAFYSLMGYSAEEVKGKIFRDIFLRQPENTPEGYAQLMENLQKGKNICRYRKTKDGGEKMIQAHYLPQRDAEGDFQGATLLILPEAQQPDTQEGPQETHAKPSTNTSAEENEAAE
jgi:PAS domain S-box-containing protein